VEKDFKSWLIRILINQCIDKKRSYYYKNLKSRAERNLDYIISKESRNFEEKDLIRMVLKEISGMQKKVLILNDLEGFSTREISAILGCSENTVRVHLFKARKKFMRIYKKYENE